MDAAYDMAIDKREGSNWQREAPGPDRLPYPGGEPPAVEAQWRALVATCARIESGDVVILLELARCLADLEDARRQVTEGGVFLMSKSGDLTENPWADRERKLRTQALQLRKSLTCLGSAVLSRDAAAEVDAAAKAEAEAAKKAAEAAEAKKKAEAAEKRRKRKEEREAARLQAVES